MLAAMNVASGPAALALRILFLFAYALMFAAVEIEIEGPIGWAEQLPTWFRLTPLYARIYGLFMRGKPLTGYHLVMFFLPLWSFHVGFVGGVPWSWAAEATTLSSYVAWVVVWDLLWFVLNPRYGWGRFRKGEVWWHSRTWIGRFPIDYYSAAGTSVVLAASAFLSTGRFEVLRNHLIFAAGMTALTVATSVAAPVYMRWYSHMRRPGSDERHLALPDRSSGSENSENDTRGERAAPRDRPS